MTHTSNPFPRTPDTHGNAWGDDTTGRFTEPYENRARAVWEATESLGLLPEFGGAGSEDGEFLTAKRPGDDEYVFLMHLEDPRDQEFLDKAIAQGRLETVLKHL